MMHTVAESGIRVTEPWKKNYVFRKTGGRWIMELTENAEKGSMDWLPLEHDELLDLLARRKNQLRLQVDVHPIEGAFVLDLLEVCTFPTGGGYYSISNAQGKEIKKRLWICDFILIVFGDIPEKIYIRKIV